MKKPAGALLSSIRLDRDSRTAISVQLCQALRALILSGGLRAGERIPATRTLARETGVSRTTVIDAVDRLVAEGMLVSRVGAGTWVSDTPGRRPSPQAPRATGAAAGGAVPGPRLSRAVSQAVPSLAPRSRLPHRAGAFVTALPALDAFPLAHWSRIAARHIRGDRDAVMGYGPPGGHAPLRRAIAMHVNALRGIVCDPAQVFVTTGAQQAFSLIGRLFLNPGDRVWMENPGASGARNALLSEGARLVPVDVDSEGLVVGDGLQKAPRFRLAFVTPSHQQPLGHVMSPARRLALLQAAGEVRGLVIEDDYDGEFYFGHAPQPALFGMDTNGRVILVGTFSKSLFPSLRLGFIVVPRRMIDTFDRLFAAWVSDPPTMTQAIVADFMEEGHFATHIRMMRRLYKARFDTLMAAAQSLGGVIDVQPTSGGFHTFARLALALDEATVVAQAAERAVTLAPLGRYCLAPVAAKGFVLGFGSATPGEIRKGVAVLRTLPAVREIGLAVL